MVNEWDWGSIVVRAEWGASLLQWYQKIFAFSFDQVDCVGQVYITVMSRMRHGREAIRLWFCAVVVLLL